MARYSVLSTIIKSLVMQTILENPGNEIKLESEFVYFQMSFGRE